MVLIKDGVCLIAARRNQLKLCRKKKQRKKELQVFWIQRNWKKLEKNFENTLLHLNLDLLSLQKNEEEELKNENLPT